MAAEIPHAQAAAENLRHTCEITEEELEAALLYELKPYAGDYIQAGERTGICPIFLAAKDALESGWGRYPMNGTNISGFYGGCVFESIPHGINYVTDFIDREYLSPDGKYYAGCTLSAVNTHWNGSAIWEREVYGIMCSIEKRIGQFREQQKTEREKQWLEQMVVCSVRNPAPPA